MLEIKTILPAGALLGQINPALAQKLSDQGAIWLLADTPEKFGFDSETEGAISLWRPNAGTTPATPAKPNTGNSHFVETDAGAGLALTAKVNCGFFIPNVIDSADRFSFAVIYSTPEGEARTLLTLNFADTKNYLFLNESEGQITLKDQKNTSEIVSEADQKQGHRHLVIGGYSNDRLYLGIGNKPVQSVNAGQLSFQGIADLFIGCRSHRSGLPKTLGNAVIQSVLFWPDQNILDQRDHEAQISLALLKDYWFWEA